MAARSNRVSLTVTRESLNDVATLVSAEQFALLKKNQNVTINVSRDEFDAFPRRRIVTFRMSLPLYDLLSAAAASKGVKVATFMTETLEKELGRMGLLKVSAPSAEPMSVFE